MHIYKPVSCMYCGDVETDIIHMVPKHNRGHQLLHTKLVEVSTCSANLGPDGLCGVLQEHA